jgi:predicted RNA-binding Zn ribbon-like protein
MTDAQQTPAPVRLVRDFVNTYERQVDEESLSTCDELRDWLVEHLLVPADTRVSATDLAITLAVREGLRGVLLGHAGHDQDPRAMAAFHAALADLPVRVDFDADGYRLVSTRTDPVGQALGVLLDAVRQASEDRTWPRLKVCARDSCQWAYYDASRNQVRRWCSMAGCGNQVKMQRAYKTRKARAGATPAARRPTMSS